MKLGHVHIKVRDLARSLEFYQTLFELELTEQAGDYFAFLTSNEMHHQLALQARGEDTPPAPEHAVGLYHIAFEVPDKKMFAQKYRQLQEMHIAPYTIDHLISWAMYFDDPDGNGLEIYVDTRHEHDGTEQWHGKNRALTQETILEHL